MIGRIQGRLILKEPPYLMVDVAGVGYEIEAPGSVFFELPELNQQTTLIIHHLVREDASILYGFKSYSQRTLFRNLLKVNGIGAKSALAVLSTMSSAEFIQMIQTQNVAGIVKVPGVGKKTAQRLIIEMKDKVGGLSVELPTATIKPSRMGISAEAISALQTLGFKPIEASNMVKKVAKEDMSTEQIIRACLQNKGNI
ncbi:MAG: Holliday junction branch migration protein RuvA [Proteobacteria bacterium]|nr:Holliday junction branch migration protein RuvA [Pseudomonadota bacterium]